MALAVGTQHPPAHPPWTQVGWAIIILASSLVIGIGTGIGVYFFEVLVGSGSWYNSRTFADVFTEIPTGIALIWMIIIRVRRSGNGPLARDLALLPIPRSRVFISVLAFEILGTAYAMISIPLRPEYAFAARRNLNVPLVDAFHAGPVLGLAYLINIILLAPIGGELLFRGWLWTALGPSWGIWPTALFTGAAWWLFHAYLGIETLKYLLLAAIILSLVRHYTGSVRATIVVHILDNVRLVIVAFVILLVSRH